MGFVWTTTVIVSALVSLIIRFPYWLVKYSLFPSTRARKSWTLRNQLRIEFVRCTIGIVSKIDISRARPFDAPPIPPNTLAYSYHVDLEPIDGAYLKGIVEESAKAVGGLDPVLDDKHGAVGPKKVPAYWFTEKKRTPNEELRPLSHTDDDLVMLYFHGGAYKFGTSHERDATSHNVKSLIEKTPITQALSVDYRLSGAAPFPAPLVDALTGYAYLLNTCKIPASRIIVSGDSAGGHLTLALARYLRDEKVFPMPAALLLLSPWADLTKSHEAPDKSSTLNAPSDYLTSGLGNVSIEQFQKGHSPSFRYSPYISPGSRFNIDAKSFEGFPETFITAGDAEMLLDAIRFLRDRMAESIGEERVTLDEIPDAPHDVHIFPGWGEEREASLRRIGTWLETRFPAAARAKLRRAPVGSVESKKDL